jgi:SAM-dependent methyltransferase
VAKRKRAAPDADAQLLGTFDLLARRRLPYAEPLAAIVADTLRRFPPLPGLPLVEIGAGAGQLGLWLAPEARAAAVHTDVSPPALRALRAGAPGARVVAAAAERLPFTGGRCGGALGLCVFDAIHARGPAADAEAVRELARVLAPGARFLHFLDMATLLETPFAKLAASGLVPIPNLFGDPSDHEWPLDIVLVRGDWLAGLLEIARPLARSFGRYFGAFLARPFDTDDATALFKAVASSGARRQELQTLLVAGSRLAVERGYPPFEPLPFHSGKYLASVLETGFRDSGCFDVEQAAIVTRSAWREPPAGDATRYRSLALGHQRISDQLPRRLLTGPIAASDSPANRTLIEAGMFVFVAKRR